MAASLEKSGFLTHIRTNRSRLSPCYRPMVVTMVRNQSYCVSNEVEIKEYLKKALPIRPPFSVFEPMHHLTFTAPRTKAPVLCIAACELTGGDRSRALAAAAAAALHLMHAATFTHENLPVTDRPRPKPEVPHKFGPNVELLTGDGIMPFGLELLARSMDQAQNDPDQILRVIVEITRAIGSQGMIDGRYRELEMDLSQENTGRVMDYVCEKKKVELHACGAACGAILGGGDEVEIEKLRKYGDYVGMIHGMLNGIGKNKEGLIEEKTERLRILALKELEIFKGKNVLISSLCSA
ncbi:heterodimeric geranylgeranyl pyrophosphate synthase small subunit, chloroplastic-like [Olea europaea var. sylvestris]|uniref:Heterodimeric geranylgeranyl pyrophosphate synthase small subunit, chloroplastic-like n=1 Tax=Olea europaea subsp. europaea TaxID=158383 RepID=A0A8S0U7G7_OLEEU|nr:heterodimeric geranylgeranyl pyrophosphate synthase small subunit, chloroplastic-like [Olea europaea var. sylvestris]CAA3014552.1 heterodimeric geranylgeranyl pyrophosphate synthase small subunit, chloroplastic-like [Olea europaea subsp. europaea]